MPLLLGTVWDVVRKEICLLHILNFTFEMKQNSKHGSFYTNLSPFACR